MQFLLVILQAINQNDVLDVVSEMNPSFSNEVTTNQPKAFMVSLVTLLIVNVFVMVGNFIFDKIKHRKDNHNHKVHLIAKKGVEVESLVYEQFQTMASLQPGDEHQLLDAIMLLDSFLNTNRLYIEKKFLTCAIEYLDYYKRIQHKMTLKDVKKEESYFERLSKAFYGE